MADSKAEPTIDGIGRLEFNAWKQSPVTRAYLKYLAAMAEDRKLTALDAWEAGKLEQMSDELRGSVNSLRIAAKPDFDAVITFYAEIDQMNKAENDPNEQDRAGL